MAKKEIGPKERALREMRERRFEKPQPKPAPPKVDGKPASARRKKKADGDAG